MSLPVKCRASALRSICFKQIEKKMLISKFIDSDQEKDVRDPLNCNGYGRIRTFKIHKHRDWSPNPLPNYPAAKALDKPFEECLRSQVFQLAACNWYCWYCFVDDDLKSGNLNFSRYFSADELIKMYLLDPNRPSVIILSGGQPDLVPEWTLWMMEELEKENLDNKVFLWSDDNLSNNYFWEYLSGSQIEYMVNYSKYSRVGCFKGYDKKSFSFNTLANPDLFDQQFKLFNKLFETGFDMYAYVTFTSIPNKNVEDSMNIFINQLQDIHENLPLRTVPLKIKDYSPTKNRINPQHTEALNFQHAVHTTWLREINNRFKKSDINLPICDVKMKI